VRWERLESLLDEAKDSTGYDAAAALHVTNCWQTFRNRLTMLPTV
jgi:hypothetical protein